MLLHATKVRQPLFSAAPDNSRWAGLLWDHHVKDIACLWHHKNPRVEKTDWNSLFLSAWSFFFLLEFRKWRNSVTFHPTGMAFAMMSSATVTTWPAAIRNCSLSSKRSQVRWRDLHADFSFFHRYYLEVHNWYILIYPQLHPVLSRAPVSQTDTFSLFRPTYTRRGWRSPVPTAQVHPWASCFLETSISKRTYDLVSETTAGLTETV